MKTQSATHRLVDHQALSDLVRDLFIAAGLSPEHAQHTAEMLVLSNLRGIDSHGVFRVQGYLKRLGNGTVNSSPEMAFHDIPGTPLAILDGDRGLGFLVADKAMGHALQKAKDYGIGLVWAKNSNHFGAAGLYAMKAAEEHMIGIVTTNVPAMVTMPSFRESVVGNNPIAVSVPMKDHPPFTVDISLSSVALGKLLTAIQDGSSIPDTWALDADGIPTTDPSAGYAGFMLPMAMHKGFALALAMDLLTGVIAGGPFLKDLPSMYKEPEKVSGTTHLMIALDPARLMEREEFYQRMESWKAELRSTVSPLSGESLHIPGEGLARIEADRRAGGIPLPPAQIEELRTLASAYGIEIPQWAHAE